MGCQTGVHAKPFRAVMVVRVAGHRLQATRMYTMINLGSQTGVQFAKLSGGLHRAIPQGSLHVRAQAGKNDIRKQHNC